MMLVDLHTHPSAHGESSFSLDTLEQFVLRGIARGCRDLGFSDHDLYLPGVKPGIVTRLQAKYPQINLRLGLEVDFRPGTEGAIREKLAPFSFDYLIGSVHEVGGWIFDHPDYMDGYKKYRGDDLYREYFALVAQAARTGIFQIIGHPDVVRVFGFKCESRLLDLARPALEAIREAGMAIEINTNGRYKPVGDFYPAREVLAEAFRLGIPVTLGSDAHEAANVARDFEDALDLLRQIGCKSIVTFAKKQRLEYPI